MSHRYKRGDTTSLSIRQLKWLEVVYTVEMYLFFFYTFLNAGHDLPEFGHDVSGLFEGHDLSLE